MSVNTSVCINFHITHASCTQDHIAPDMLANLGKIVVRNDFACIWAYGFMYTFIYTHLYIHIAPDMLARLDKIVVRNDFACIWAYGLIYTFMYTYLHIHIYTYTSHLIFLQVLTKLLYAMIGIWVYAYIYIYIFIHTYLYISPDVFASLNKIVVRNNFALFYREPKKTLWVDMIFSPLHDIAIDTRRDADAHVEPFVRVLYICGVWVSEMFVCCSTFECCICVVCVGYFKVSCVVVNPSAVYMWCVGFRHVRVL